VSLVSTLDPICVVIGRTRHKMVQAEIQEAARQGARFLELRLDFLAKPPDFKRLLQDKPCKILATVRRPADGGRWAGTEDARKLLLRQAIVSGVDWVDLESDIIDTIPRFGKVGRIVSYHNLQGVPSELEKIHEGMCAKDVDVVKIAVRIQSPLDNLRVLDLLKGAKKPTVALCMGDMGMPSRVLGRKFGAPFTYAAFNPERGIAPGLPSFRELRDVYHYREVNAATQVFGVLGDPVAHSLSPVLHNSAFHQMKIDAVYLPVRVPRNDFAATIKAFKQLGFKGYSITIPHKEVAAGLATTRDTAVIQTESANTLVQEGDNFAAYNTDYPGVISALYENLPKEMPKTDPERPIAGRTALILGAGGVARSVAFALNSMGALVTVTNRTPERGHKLAAEANCKFVEWTLRHQAMYDLVINCTSVGMHPNLDESPFNAKFMRQGMLFFDTVYTPETTLLIKDARERDCHTITGSELFVRQAAQQYRLFTGKDAPTDLIRKTVKQVLSPVTVKHEEPDEPERGDA
jgi:3-dehydroquinate dehydratase/shikimate dehydrogenase